ncbi:MULTISPECIES: TetR/AcrR family transcriptional regulator [Mycobacterium]|uniref:TetR/AcrR family transcriptional regulator n=1 Tax=Mycobacterium TaxID=1763 RepID=UPI00105D77F9|nr:TetR/AcrR family transcriptional regulator [Mycobacterium paragordonae]MBX9981211.1 TetR/AcrR family transcriptional regulator [Mycobacterium gordonae]TDK88391.1 TetR/AcrR family transcriptional regulator [Mycobacterium paragordonae]TDK99871.1 TetR/AcrR family transcriptional regulator [Mycobacterium paragordonae]
MVSVSRAEPTRRLPRERRREQILDAATRAFARAGFADTGLDAVAAEAGVTPVILYRHFASKADLYREVLDYGYRRLREATGADEFDDASIPALVRAAAADPEAFRLLFRYAAREPEFCDVIERALDNGTEITRRYLAGIADERWRSWAAHLLPTVTMDAVIAWLDAGRPDPDQAAARIRRIVDAVIHAAQPR